MKAYLASPLGFAASTRVFMDQLITTLRSQIEVVNPWDDQRFAADFARIPSIDSVAERKKLLQHINHELGKKNAESIQACDAVIAVLDGVDVDSGTAAEIGYAYGLGKHVWGIRTDFRLAGDNEGAIVNLQVEYFIHQSGGEVVTTVEELMAAVLASLPARG
jgi:nucleoside 2-deoxyribosyltransferase